MFTWPIRLPILNFPKMNFKQHVFQDVNSYSVITVKEELQHYEDIPLLCSGMIFQYSHPLFSNYRPCSPLTSLSVIQRKWKLFLKKDLLFLNRFLTMLKQYEICYFLAYFLIYYEILIVLITHRHKVLSF